MTDKTIKIWVKVRERLCQEYSFVGFLLSPNLTIMKEESEQKTDDNEEYVAIIINNMLLNLYLVDRERVE